MSLTRRKISMWWTTMVTRGQNEKKALHQVSSFYFLWFVSGWTAISTVICTNYLGPDIWSASLNSTNGGKHKTRQCLTQKYRPEETADSSTRGFPAKWQLRNKRGNFVWISNLEMKMMWTVVKENERYQYWWRVTTQIRVVLLIGRASREIWFDQSGALPRSG